MDKHYGHIVANILAKNGYVIGDIARKLMVNTKNSAQLASNQKPERNGDIKYRQRNQITISGRNCQRYL
jgi:hypothetical protein